MRSDLTPAFIAAKDAAFRRPRQLLIFHFADESVYLSDQKISLGGHDYLPLVEDWGRLDTAGDDEQDTGEIRQMSITIWNGGESPFSDRFLVESPENVEVELYQWFVGLADSDKALIDRFVIQDPISYGAASRLLTLDLVSLGMRYDGPVGELLTTDDFPHALDADVNKGIPLIVGSPGQVKTLCGRTAPSATMTGSILLLPTIVNVHEDLDELGFAASGKIQIDEEIMEFSGRDSDTFTVTGRGVDGTTAAEHSDGATVVQHITDHTYIVGQPLAEINDVQVGGIPATAGTYTVHPDTEPATIVFNSKPFKIEYSKGARETFLDFDASTAANNAYQPHYAYAEEEKSNGALISRNYTPLALIQTDPAPDDGEVVRAFLSVEHWATDQYLNDTVEVWVDGLGVVGQLAKPNEADVVEFSADVDIDHTHGHQTGGSHTHHNIDPDYQSLTNDHLHDLDGSESSVVGTIDTSMQTMQAGHWGDSLYLPYGPYNANTTRAFVQFRVDGCSYKDSSGPWVEIAGEKIYCGDTSTHGVWITSKTQVHLTSGGGDSSLYVPHINVYIVDITIMTSASVTASAPVPVTTTKSGSGQVLDITEAATVIKSPDDVNPFAEANRQLENIVTSSASRSVTQLFDLTKLLQTISWDWFQNREIQLRYVGTTNTADIIVTYVSFKVEYRQRETVFSDDVSCSPVGLIDNSPDNVIKYLLHDKAGLDLQHIELAAAGLRFADLGYQLDGVIPAGITVRTAIKNICRQTRSRLIWQAGVAKLVVKEKSESWSSVKNILPGDLQQKAIAVKRQPVSAIVNTINLFFKKDHLTDTDDPTAYRSTANTIDQESIDRHGQRRDDDGFMFDMVTSPAMAESLADFYLWLLAEPSTFYDFTGYLPCFDLEKEDVATFTSDGFAQIIRLPMVIRAADRIFGSAKNNSINLYRVLAESIRHRLITITSEDIVSIADTLSIEWDMDTEAADPLLFTDIFISELTKTSNEAVSVSDVLYQVFDMVLTNTEPVSISDTFTTETTITTNDTVIVYDVHMDEWDGDIASTDLDTAVTDESIIDSGFGSPLGDGWGVVPFGSPK